MLNGGCPVTPYTTGISKRMYPGIACMYTAGRHVSTVWQETTVDIHRQTDRRSRSRRASGGALLLLPLRATTAANMHGTACFWNGSRAESVRSHLMTCHSFIKPCRPNVHVYVYMHIYVRHFHFHFQLRPRAPRGSKRINGTRRVPPFAASVLFHVYIPGVYRSIRLPTL